MASFTSHLSENQIAWIQQQPMYFVATAPLQADGHINLSPKGLDSFRVLDEKTVAYLDITGSGNETSAHIHENGRVTFMWCSFGARQIIVNHISKTQTSCGFVGPVMEFKHNRDTLTDWASNQGKVGIQEYQQKKNVQSLDGLPTPLGIID